MVERNNIINAIIVITRVVAVLHTTIISIKNHRLTYNLGPDSGERVFVSGALTSSDNR